MGFTPKESQMLTSLKIGCSGLEPSEYPEAGGVSQISEVELLAYSSWSVSERRALHRAIRFGHQVIGSCSSAWLVCGDEREKALILEEICSELQVSQMIVRVQ